MGCYSLPALILKFRCHSNAELCISKVGSIKNLLKYLCKGPDGVTVEVGSHKSKDASTNVVRKVPSVNEIRIYQNARYIFASEASWRLFFLPMVEHYPFFQRLEAHLKGKHKVFLRKGTKQTRFQFVEQANEANGMVRGQ